MEKYEFIAQEIRRRITQGQFAPKTRLPTRDEVGREFNASRMTVQRAFNQLMRQGFIEARTRQGSFVAAHPPHLCRIGLVFPRRPGKYAPWPRFWLALQQAAEAMSESARRQLPIFYSGEARPESEDYLQLVRELQNHRLGGLMFMNQPEDLIDSPVLNESGLPRVAIMAEPLVRQMPVVFPDLGAFIDRALDLILDRGRKRIAIVTPGHQEGHVDHIRSAVHARGLVMRPSWLQIAGPFARGSARGIAMLLMDRPPEERPDALVVTDDNLVEEAISGLVAAGVRVPEDLVVIAHCNFPAAPVTALDVVKLGFDAYELLQRCVEIIDQQREGQDVPSKTLLPARFEHELGRP
jgi:DNA-binding LacI/PurR family transcriptional regulator